MIPHSRLRALSLPYIDLLAAVDAVLCKTGYGVVAELIATGRVALYTDRPGWVEHDWLVKGLHANVPAMRVSNDEALSLDASLWPRIEALLAQRRPPTIATNGPQQAADIILAADSLAAARTMAAAAPAPGPAAASGGATAPATAPVTAAALAAAKNKNKKKKKKPAANAPAAATPSAAAPAAAEPAVAPSAASVATPAPPPAAAAGAPESAATSAEAPAAAATELDPKALFEKELAWCVNQLRVGLKRQKDPAQRACPPVALITQLFTQTHSEGHQQGAEHAAIAQDPHAAEALAHARGVRRLPQAHRRRGAPRAPTRRKALTRRRLSHMYIMPVSRFGARPAFSCASRLRSS